MKVRGTFILALFACNILAAQTPCPSPEDLDGKALKLYEKADAIRSQLIEKGVVIEDSASETFWYWK